MISGFYSARCAIFMPITLLAGLSDLANEGTWVWSSDNSRLGYSNWDINEPNMGTYENCASVSRDGNKGIPGEWWDSNCNNNQDYGRNFKAICQKA